MLSCFGGHLVRGLPHNRRPRALRSESTRAQKWRPEAPCSSGLRGSQCESRACHCSLGPYKPAAAEAPGNPSSRRRYLCRTSRDGLVAPSCESYSVSALRRDGLYLRSCLSLACVEGGVNEVRKGGLFKAPLPCLWTIDLRVGEGGCFVEPQALGGKEGGKALPFKRPLYRYPEHIPKGAGLLVAEASGGGTLKC